ncbi:hypothetical protein CEP54_005994 [Fusarium duplospermum]|uniref:Sacsin/Nov domain-containing protein n=1 Tax=Fusarium duplospermum TaxID=1325734 RepID=A0A428Q9I8_9HYPO|nr:hypothetical protein CEP54_005994 [Fusarium duplospermum]
MESDEIPQSESSRARDFIAELGGKNGFVEKKYWDELSEAGRAKFQRAISSLQGELEPAIKALAQSLYSSTGRFVFELLQNAEDCNFYFATRRNESPYISFHLSEDRLVIECNEDGFTKADLEAICSIGKSSKSATKGYIGEKGIGFKSVFMAAWKVHIQSGPYSFYFKHCPSDGGMGMITPIWQESTDELPRHMTRMTLHLHTEGDPQAISAQRDSLRQQLCTLNGNFLLFMNKLAEIRIIIDEDGSQTSTIFSKSQADDCRIKILKTVTEDDSDETESSSTLFHITKHQVHNLSKNENRTYSEEENRRKEYSTAEVILAFPLTPEYEPVIESQEIFAFLPVQAAGFPFLIQSDFMTNASRQHIVTTAARNVSLRDGISDAFIEAVLEFCNHGTLQFTWMEFLPDKNKVYSEFWSALVTDIEARVRETPLIRPDSGGPLRLVTSLRNLRPALADEENNLLLRDLTPELSISRHYGRSRLAILENLGLENFYWNDFIRMVNQDLQSSDSWIKSRVSDSFLQTRVANLLRDYYKNTAFSETRSMIEKLPIIPLQDGRWLAATSEEKIFFPNTSGLTVPEDLEFNLIEPSAASKWVRRKLFITLGVESLSVRSVRERIFKRHKSYWEDPGKNIQFYAQQLKFLYSTHDRKTHHVDDYCEVLLIDDSLIQRKSTTCDVYLPDDNPLGPQELLRPIKGGCDGWHQVAECLWASEIDLPGWAILEPYYEDLENFFVEFLGVKTLSLELVYRELNRLGSSSDTAREEIEPNIWSLNSFLSAGVQPPDAKTLLDRRIFPVRYPDGHVRLEKATVEFAIVDREQLGDIFKPRAKTLDFDLDEVRMLEPTLTWLGLGERCLSEAVQEVSRVQGPSKEPLSTPERSIKPRAHALYRIAYHYNSPRLDEWDSYVYTALESALVYETDGIAATLSLNQDGREICYEKGLSDLHIEEEGDSLNVFVPRDKKSQESCYARKLPWGLFKWLMTPSDGGQVTLNEKGLRITASVLNSSRSVIADILEEEGIAAGEFEDDYEEVEEPEEAHTAEETPKTGESHATEETDEVEESDVEESHVVEDVASSSDGDPIDTPALTETEAEETPSLTSSDSSQPAALVRQETTGAPIFDPSSINQGVATVPPTRRQPTRSRRFSSSDITEDVSYFEARSDVATTTTNQPTVQPIPAVPALTDRETTQYQALLERVVTAARGSPRLPSQGAYDMTGMSHALSDLMGDGSCDEVDQFPRFRSSSQYERDRKIGAAGELYVFELLKNLSPGIPGFSLENWRSTIRRYASAHPDYTNIGNWNHRETSDFEYDDSEGALTELMIDNGYLDRDIWENKKPRYYLEVKTTTGPCESPFYMSKGQYRLMHECRDSTDKIYVVFRVYEVEKTAVQLRVYVNPAKLEGSGRLIYTAETWSVRPGAGT